MNPEYIELNSAYPVNLGWRHISVTKIYSDALDFRLIGIAGQEETGTLELGGVLNLDDKVYRLVSVHHRAPDVNKSRRHVAGILSVGQAS
jgi:hypothetical protein